MSVQAFVEWGKTPLSGGKRELDVFVVEEPYLVDVLAITGVNGDLRHKMKVWTVGLSDVSGCVNLSRPQPLTPRCSPLADSMPVLALVDLLAIEGYTSKMEVCRHSRKGLKVYDSRSLPSSRRYLQAVLSGPELFRAKVTAFSSGCSAAYYNLLLASKEDVPTGLSAEEYKKRLRGVSGSAGVLALTDARKDVEESRLVLLGSEEDEHAKFEGSFGRVAGALIDESTGDVIPLLRKVHLYKFGCWIEAAPFARPE